MNNRSILRSISATTITLLLAVPASSAFASDDTGSEIPSSTTDRRSSRVSTADERAAAKAARQEWISTRRGIEVTRRAAVAAAREELRTALAAAESPEDRAEVRAAFKSKIRAANESARTAIRELGPRPAPAK